jgi:hypothetical protein
MLKKKKNKKRRRGGGGGGAGRNPGQTERTMSISCCPI